MTTTIQNCINYVQTQATATITKIKHAPQYVTDSVIATPTMLTWADNIEIDNSVSAPLTFFDMHIEIVRKNEPLEDAFKWMEDIPDSVNTIFETDPTLGGNCATYGRVTANIVEKMYTGVMMIGYHIVIPRVKITSA